MNALIRGAIGKGFGVQHGPQGSLFPVVVLKFRWYRYSDLELEDLAIESTNVNRMADMLVRTRLFLVICCKRDLLCRLGKSPRFLLNC